jgi:hypothetical protein
MKTIGALGAVVFALAASSAFVSAEAAVGPTAQNSVSIDAGSLVFYPLWYLIERMTASVPVTVGYRRAIADHLSLLIDVGASYGWIPADPPADSDLMKYYGHDWWAFGVNSGVEVTWHPFHQSPNGFELGLAGFFNYSTSYSNGTLSKGRRYEYWTGLGVTTGWRFAVSRSICLEPRLGVAYAYSGGADIDGTKRSYAAPVLILPNVFLGFRF